MDDRLDLLGTESDPLSKKCRMYAPFVLAVQACGRAIDHDFTLAQAQWALVEQAAREHL